MLCTLAPEPDAEEGCRMNPSPVRAEIERAREVVSIGVMLYDSDEHVDYNETQHAVFEPKLGSCGVASPSVADIAVQFNACVTKTKLCEVLREIVDQIEHEYPHDDFYRENIEAYIERTRG